MKNNNDSGSNANRTRRWWENPWVQGLFVIFGIVGTIGGIFTAITFYTGREVRSLVYAVNPVRTSIVDMGLATGIEVLFNGEQLGKVDISVVQIAVWNSGDLPIRPENILSPIFVISDPPVRILEATVRNQPRSDITHFDIEASPQSFTEGKVPISWRILESRDGASIQLIYMGAQTVVFYLEGVIEGAGDVKSVQPRQRDNPWLPLTTAITAFIGIVSIIFMHWYYSKHNWQDLPISFYIGTLILFSAIFIVGLVFLTKSILTTWPPFGF